MNQKVRQLRDELDKKLAPAVAWYQERETREQRILQLLAALLARTAGEIQVHSLPQNPKPAEDDPTISVLQIGKKPSVIHVESQTGSIELHAMKSSRLR